MKKYILYCLIGLLNPITSLAVDEYEFNDMGPKIVANGDVFIYTCHRMPGDEIEWDYDRNYVQWTGGGAEYDDFIELKAVRAGNTQIKVKYFLPKTFGGYEHYMTAYMNLNIQNGCIEVDYNTTSGFVKVIGNYDFRLSSCRLNFAEDLNGTMKGIIQGKESIKLNPGVQIKNGSNLSLIIGSNSLRSSNESEYEELSEEVFEEFKEATSISDIIEIPQTVQINIYSIAGLLVYSSITDFDIQSANLEQGIYIVETINDKGEIKREKVLINR